MVSATCIDVVRRIKINWSSDVIARSATEQGAVTPTLLDVVDDRARRRARPEHLATPGCLSRSASSSGIVPPTRNSTSPRAVLPSAAGRAPSAYSMCAPDRLDSPSTAASSWRTAPKDRVGRLEDPGVDDLHAGVAQRPRDHLGPAVVAVEARLREDDLDRLFLCSLAPTPRRPSMAGTGPRRRAGRRRSRRPSPARARRRGSPASRCGAGRGRGALDRPQRLGDAAPVALALDLLQPRELALLRRRGRSLNSSMPADGPVVVDEVVDPTTARRPDSSATCCSQAESAMSWLAKPK